jgi:DNA-binding SARP family transcriptional activator
VICSCRPEGRAGADHILDPGVGPVGDVGSPGRQRPDPVTRVGMVTVGLTCLLSRRQAIGAEALRSRDDAVWLEPDGLWVDVDAFQAAVAAGDAPGALGLFRGDLLPDDPFEPWAEERRELFRMQLLRLALRLAAELEQADELGRASSVLERVVELDALNEEAHFRLARVQAKAGHRHLALRTCLQLQERLRQELGERPSTEACQLRDDIVAGRIGPDTYAQVRRDPVRVRRAGQYRWACRRGGSASTPDAVQA